MAKHKDYRSMMDELQALLSEMQAEDLDVDAAMQKYARGEALVHELEQYLKTAENTITELRPDVSKAE